MLGTDASADQVANGLAHLTRELQAAGRAERAMYFGLYADSFD
jgi:hypothetical protein